MLGNPVLQTQQCLHRTAVGSALGTRMASVFDPIHARVVPVGALRARNTSACVRVRVRTLERETVCVKKRL